MDSLKLLFIVLPGLFLAAGLILMGLSLAASFRRKRSMAGWQEASATVTGNLHGTDGPASNGRNRFAPSYEFVDAGGKRWRGSQISTARTRRSSVRTYQWSTTRPIPRNRRCRSSLFPRAGWRRVSLW